MRSSACEEMVAVMHQHALASLDGVAAAQPLGPPHTGHRVPEASADEQSTEAGGMPRLSTHWRVPGGRKKGRRSALCFQLSEPLPFNAVRP